MDEQGTTETPPKPRRPRQKRRTAEEWLQVAAEANTSADKNAAMTEYFAAVEREKK